ncbi:hypothetical protein SS50377_22673 [Spironucleus salmonicida]|uniref:Uncharacterized protein n=1 Tax=Spironucleus salmonicida TaxID=348837 RepID=V6LXL6_9EUKA|nr:hypothetical protein SS50377_22673 [Spironucleus salmonicida]|eukprot:EST48993.1 Hypothetical protein SS50377_10763 [Spironucleus salmonicida]
MKSSPSIILNVQDHKKDRIGFSQSTVNLPRILSTATKLSNQFLQYSSTAQSQPISRAITIRSPIRNITQLQTVESYVVNDRKLVRKIGENTIVIHDDIMRIKQLFEDFVPIEILERQYELNEFNQIGSKALKKQGDLGHISSFIIKYFKQIKQYVQLKGSIHYLNDVEMLAKNNSIFKTHKQIQQQRAQSEFHEKFQKIKFKEKQKRIMDMVNQFRNLQQNH